MYRLIYNFIAGVSLVVVTIILSILSSHPDNQVVTPLIIKTSIIEILGLVVNLIGFLFIIGSVIQVNPFKFAGLQAETLEQDLKSGLFYRFSRHPMYFGVVLLLAPGIFLSSNLVWIIQNIIFVSYIVIGGFFEEKRLSRTLTGYQVMFDRGFLFPWKFQHFKLLISKNLTISS